MPGGQRGVTLIEVVVVLLVLAALMGGAVPTVGAALEGYRAGGATADLYAAVHLTKARARAKGMTHALVIEPDGQGFRIVADLGGDAQTVEGPHRLVDGASATSNITIQFSPKGFAVPAGTITVRSGGETRRIVVNILGLGARCRRRGPPREERSHGHQRIPRRGRNGRQDVGAAWQKTRGSSGPFLAIEIDAGAVIADAIAALVRGDERLSYLAFTNEKKPDGRDGQPDLRLVRPLRRGGDDAA